MTQQYMSEQDYKERILKNPHDSSLIDAIPIEKLVTTLLKLPHDIFKQIVITLPHDKLAQALSIVESNQAKHLMARIKTIDAKLEHDIYKLLPNQQQENIKKLSQYPDTQIGAYMHLEVLSATLDENIRDIKEKIKTFETSQQHAPFIEIFITNKKEHLLTSIDISTLMLYEDEKTLEDICQEIDVNKALMINEHASINNAVKLFEDNDLSTLGVVDKKGKLLGRILFDDVYTFIHIQEEKQALNMLGTHHAAEKSFGTAQRKRLEWIFINLCAILLSAMVVNHFKGTIEQIVTLAVLMPVVAALGGDVGNQAVTVTVRRLALGDTGYSISSIITKEFFIGVVNGVIVGAVVGLIAYIWFHQAMLGVVVGLAIIINLSLAGLIGSALPIIMKRFNIDPAIASPLLLTTATDTMGFFIFLGLATLILLK